MLPMTLQGPDVLGNDSLCVTEDGSPVDILFLVHTAVPHFSRRLNLRRTYMAPEYFWPYKVCRISHMSVSVCACVSARARVCVCVCVCVCMRECV